jgi:hypothetical protein
MADRVLLVLAAFAFLYGCGQVSSPAEREEKQGGVEEATPTEPTEQATGKAEGEPSDLFSASASASSAFFRLPEEQAAAQAEANCRVATYVSNENMSQQESRDFVHRVADLTAQEMMADHSLSAGSALKKVLNDLGVPRYPECKMGGDG